MPEENATIPTNDNSAALISQLTETNNTLKAQLESLKSNLTTSQEANKITSQKVGTLEAQLATLTVDKSALETSKAELNTSLASITEQLAQATGVANEAQSKLAVYNVISSDPKYFDMMDSVADLNLPSDPEGIKTVLDKWAEKLSAAKETAAETAVNNFKAGALPNGGASGNNAGDNTPKTKAEAFNMAQSALAQNNLEAFDQYVALASTLEQ